MNDRRPTELELAAALRAHLPAMARADLRDRIHLATATVPQQRALPSMLGALTDADPIGRQRAVLIAAALLVAVALAGAAVIGALNDRENDLLPLGGQGPLVFLRQNDLYLANADGSDAFPVARIDGAELRNPRWSADGRLIAFQTREGRLRRRAGRQLSGPSIIVHDVGTGKTRRLTPGTFGGWSPDGHSLAYFTTNGDIAIVDAQSGESRTLVARPAGTNGFCDGSRSTRNRWPGRPTGDGSWPDGCVARRAVGPSSVSMPPQEQQRSSTPTPTSRYRVDWSPDSSRVVFAGCVQRRSDRTVVGHERRWKRHHRDRRTGCAGRRSGLVPRRRVDRVPALRAGGGWRADDRPARWQRRSPARGQCRAHRGLEPRRGLGGLHRTDGGGRAPRRHDRRWSRSGGVGPRGRWGLRLGQRRFVTRAVPWWRPACLRPSHRCHPIADRRTGGRRAPQA